MRVKKPTEIPAPAHLGKRSSALWVELCDQFIFESHDLERLRIVCESIDTIDDAETAMRRDGRFVDDRYGQKKPHPAIVVARDARVTLLRALRELSVDVDVPDARIPRQARRYA